MRADPTRRGSGRHRVPAYGIEAVRVGEILINWKHEEE